MALKEYYTVQDIQDIYGCSRQKAYSIVGCKGFPKTKIRKTYYINIDEFKKWQSRNLYSEVLL